MKYVLNMWVPFEYKNPITLVDFKGHLRTSEIKLQQSFLLKTNVT